MRPALANANLDACPSSSIWQLKLFDNLARLRLYVKMTTSATKAGISPTGETKIGHHCRSFGVVVCVAFARIYMSSLSSAKFIPCSRILVHVMLVASVPLTTSYGFEHTIGVVFGHFNSSCARCSMQAYAQNPRNGRRETGGFIATRSEEFICCSSNSRTERNIISSNGSWARYRS